MSQLFASSYQVLKLQLQYLNFQSIFRTDSFRIYWFDFLAVQGTLKSILQHPNLKASVLWCSICFTVHFSHPYMTTGKTRALTRWTFVGKVMSPLFNMLCRLVIAFSSKEHLSLNFMTAVTIHSDFGAQEKKICRYLVSPSICHEVMGLNTMIFAF